MQVSEFNLTIPKIVLTLQYRTCEGTRQPDILDVVVASSESLCSHVAVLRLCDYTFKLFSTSDTWSSILTFGHVVGVNYSGPAGHRSRSFVQGMHGGLMIEVVRHTA